jgi:hypothetical protein
MRMPNTGLKKTGFVFLVGLITLLLSLQVNNTYGQSCFPSGCNIRIKFTGGTLNGSNQIQICSGDSTLLTIDTSGCTGANFSGLSFKWQFNTASSGNTNGWTDFGTSNPNRINDSIYVKNDHRFRLIITGSSPTCETIVDKFRNGGQDYDVRVVIVSLPNVSVSANNDNVCANSSTGATLTASGASTYVWTPAGGLSATTGSSVTARPTSTTTYTVTGTSSAGCKSSDQITINAVNPPNADFTTNLPSSGCASNRRVDFNATCSSGCSNLSYEWNFGDPGSGGSNTSSQRNPSHQFTNTNQNYSVRLIVRNGSGCRDTVTKTISIGAVPDVTIVDGIDPFNPFKFVVMVDLSLKL